MVKKTRIILFLFCLFLFFLIATISIFYSHGYRVDLKTKKIVQTGGIFLKVEPKPAKVFIDEKLRKKTDFLFGTILIKNLLPGIHKIRVEKEGFYPWEKNLEIKEKEVTEAKNIVLISENPNFKVLAEGVKNFWAFPNERKFIFLRESGEGEVFTSYAVEDGKESDLTNATTSEILSQKINNDTYYLDKSGYLFKNKFSFQNFSNSEIKNGEKLADRAFKDFKISPSFQKLVLINDYEVWVLFLEPQFAAPQRGAFEKVYLTRFSKKIGEIFWYTSDYLIFRVGEEIKITEIDNRDRLNIVDLANFKEVEKIFFNQANKKLYILSQGDFFASEKLLP